MRLLTPRLWPSSNAHCSTDSSSGRYAHTIAAWALTLACYTVNATGATGTSEHATVLAASANSLNARLTSPPA